MNGNRLTGNFFGTLKAFPIADTKESHVARPCPRILLLSNGGCDRIAVMNAEAQTLDRVPDVAWLLDIRNLPGLRTVPCHRLVHRDRAGGIFSPTPYFDSNSGAFSQRLAPQFPYLTFPSHATLATGRNRQL